MDMKSRKWLELGVGLVLLATGIGMIFTGSPWVGFMVLMLALLVLGF